MAALTTADLERPATDVPPSRRIRTPEELGYEIEQLDSADFKLSPAGEARRKALADELAEQSAVAAVSRQAILNDLKLGDEIEAKANEAIAALETYVTLREQLLPLRETYDKAWRAARDLGIQVGPRVRTAAPQALTNRATKVAHWPWYL